MAGGRGRTEGRGGDGVSAGSDDACGSAWLEGPVPVVDDFVEFSKICAETYYKDDRREVEKVLSLADVRCRLCSYAHSRHTHSRHTHSYPHIHTLMLSLTFSFFFNVSEPSLPHFYIEQKQR